MSHNGNMHLARMLRETMKLHEESWDGERYTLYVGDAARLVAGDDPIVRILDCLLVSGYSEVWDFCDEVLGPEDFYVA